MWEVPAPVCSEGVREATIKSNGMREPPSMSMHSNGIRELPSMSMHSNGMREPPSMSMHYITAGPPGLAPPPGLFAPPACVEDVEPLDEENISYLDSLLQRTQPSAVLAQIE